MGVGGLLEASQPEARAATQGPEEGTAQPAAEGDLERWRKRGGRGSRGAKRSSHGGAGPVISGSIMIKHRLSCDGL